jgi:hypothetical protein
VPGQVHGHDAGRAKIGAHVGKGKGGDETARRAVDVDADVRPVRRVERFQRFRQRDRVFK